MKLYIYHQSCVMAGHSVPERVLEQHENPDEGGDWFVVEGTDTELLDYARSEVMAGKTAGAGNDRYRRQVAKTILNSIGLSREEIDREVYGPKKQKRNEKPQTN